MESKAMKNYVGVVAVKCQCIFCPTCAVSRDVLFRPEDNIGRADAIKSKLKCSSCGDMLVEHKTREGGQNDKT